MTQIKKGDFVELDYIGRIKGNDKIFDLTLSDVAVREGIFRKDHKYRPLIICVGKRHLVQGVDEFLEGKEIGKEYEFEVAPEKAFGKRNSKLLQLAPSSFFKEKKINPVPGLTLAVDDALATVRSVSSGRVTLDFNHPLAGRTLVYWIKIIRNITKENEKIQAILSLLLSQEAKIKITEKEDIIELKNEINPKVAEGLKKHIQEIIPETAKKDIKFTVEKEKPVKKEPSK